MKFILQDRMPLFDFQYELYRQKEYINWLNAGRPDYLRTEMEIHVGTNPEPLDPLNWCPVGSVEFCNEWFKKYYNKTAKPINVPDELIPLQHRKIIDLYKESWNSLSGDEIFVKDAETIKSEYNGIKLKTSFPFIGADHKIYNHFQASEIIPEIYSEWRCFVHNGTLIDIKNYAGDPFNIPQREYIEKLIDEYKSASCAYTLDVCQCKYGTEVIEVHDFFSCGLYGFNTPDYPFMLWRWFKEFTSK